MHFHQLLHQTPITYSIRLLNSRVVIGDILTINTRSDVPFPLYLTVTFLAAERHRSRVSIIASLQSPSLLNDSFPEVALRSLCFSNTHLHILHSLVQRQGTQSYTAHTPKHGVFLFALCPIRLIWGVTFPAFSQETHG